MGPYRGVDTSLTRPEGVLGVFEMWDEHRYHSGRGRITLSQSVIVVDEKDNVATAVRELERGDSVRLEVGDDVVDVAASQTIPIGGKIALTDITRWCP